jgi:translocator protein
MIALINEKKVLRMRILATVAFLAMLTVNALANILPINGLTTGDVAALFPSLFTPAGVTFSIWSVIYLLLTGFLIYIWTMGKSNEISVLLPGFVVSCVLNITWIIFWHHLYPGVSVLIMILLLVTLTGIFLKIQKNIIREKNTILFVVIPFTVYLAWISVATIANISAWLGSLVWTPFEESPQLWTVIMMIAASAISLSIFVKYQSPEFPAVIVWALFGIFLRWKGSEYTAVQYVSIGLIIVLIVIMFTFFIRKGKTSV